MSLLSPQLIAFERIVEHKTVHGAAHSLHLTQTAVTQRIRALEQKLKTTLFIRTRNGMRLTTEGEALYRYCQRVNELSGEALASIQGTLTDIQSRVTIAAPTSIMRSRIVKQCQLLMRQYPNLYFTLLLSDEEDLSHHLKSGEADIIILPKEYTQAEMEIKELQEEEYLLVCTPKWKNRKLADIIAQEKIIDFNQQDNMTFSYLKKYKLLKYVKHDRHFINNTESIAECFMTGDGYGVLSKEFAEPYLKLKKLILLNEEKSYIYPLCMAWYKRPEPAEYFKKIINSIR